MKSTVIVDTNVPMVANGTAAQAGTRCVVACIDELLRIREEDRLLIDSHGLILDEYRRHLSPSGQPGPGDAFFKWVWDHQVHPDYVQRVSVSPNTNPDLGFDEFPADPALYRFDPSDRKFVAVALGSRLTPPVVNASDTDWWVFRDALRKHGITVRFLCPELMAKSVKRRGR